MNTPLPTNIGRPATAALAAANITCLEDVSTLTEKELAGLHGVGPKAIGILKQCLDDNKLRLGKVFIHATITLDGYMAGADGDMSWMQDLEAVDEDYAVADKITADIGAIIGGSNKTNTIEEGGIPYGGTVKVPVFLMTHEAHEPIEKDGITYTFVVDDIKQAVDAAKAAAGDKNVSLLGGSIARQCLKLGLVDEIVLHVEPLLLGGGISLFDGLSETVKLKRLETLAFAGETHLRFAVVKAGYTPHKEAGR